MSRDWRKTNERFDATPIWTGHPGIDEVIRRYIADEGPKNPKNARRPGMYG